MEFYFPKTPGLGFEFSPGIPQGPDRLAYKWRHRRPLVVN